jgi:hypothetical protein
VAGYSAEVPWIEAMFVDLLFLAYLFRGRARTAPHGRSQRFAFPNGYEAVSQTTNPLKIARWVYEDFPRAKALGFVVHRRRPGRGPAVIEHYP